MKEFVPETKINIELLELAHDAFTDLLDHGVELEEFCYLCADSIRSAQQEIEDRINESHASDDLHNTTSLPPKKA